MIGGQGGFLEKGFWRRYGGIKGGCGGYRRAVAVYLGI